MKIDTKIKEEINNEVSRLNGELFNKENYFKTRVSGKFLYLDFFNGKSFEKRCRLEYTGDMINWNYSIFLWSNEKYSNDIFFVPGIEKFDGTIKGGMLAGDAAYPKPVRSKSIFSIFSKNK